VRTLIIVVILQVFPRVEPANGHTDANFKPGEAS
jgi:hypothetical protein